MATYTVTSVQRISNYAVVQTLTPHNLAVGASFSLSGLAQTSLNGSWTVYALPPYEYIGIDSEGDLLLNDDVMLDNQILFYSVGSNINRDSTESVGTLTFTQTCTWITADDITSWLGIQPTVTDEVFLTQCASAASSYAYRRRVEAGYTDSLTVVPGEDVKLATTMIGGSYFRQRSAFNSIASYDQMGVPQTGLSPMVMQLLGVAKPQVA